MGQDIKEIHNSPDYQFTELPIKDTEGFRLVYFHDGDVVATELCVRVVDFGVFPDETAQVLKKKSDSGIPVYMGNISVNPEFYGKGIGTAIMKASMKRLIEKYPTVIFSNVDDSVPVGWTSRRVPEIREYMKSLGWKSEELFQGLTDGKPTWVAQYSPE